ncbi:uncharacterized protein [Procambarus clarkii]|uniref:uncharacterized protein isoform X2 n=1 Tax=Procambarus clarkii TaxID=6728 RepID=UPI001E678A3A|nr:uncharacterized protein LOC123746086 isoform X2 [Procambarus clarkii]
MMNKIDSDLSTMPRLRLPVDLATAKEVMKKFPDMAYSLNHSGIFQNAVRMLYGEEFTIKTDLSSRMLFSCMICNREMNSENAMAEHFRSGAHQKNRDKKCRESGEVNLKALASNYPTDSLHYKLLNSKVQPLGLQLVEEYVRGRGSPYYKCNLCGAHGKLDTMYHHLIGRKHTEKYIKSSCVLRNSILTPNEREELRRQVIAAEGINTRGLKTIRGSDYFPYKWKEEGRAVAKHLTDVKIETRSPSSSPSPGPSGSRTPIGRGYLKRSPKRSPGESPVSSPERYSSKPSKGCRKISPVRRSLSREKSPLSLYRNKSPPLPTLDAARIELNPVQLPPLPPLPPPPPPRIVDTKDQEVQKHDLEELMVQLNFIVKTHAMPDSDLQNPDDEKMALDLMFKISDALYSVPNTLLEEPGITQMMTETATAQREFLKKIMGYLKHRLEPSWFVENRRRM